MTLDVTSILLELLLTIALPMAIGYVLSLLLLSTIAHPVVLYLGSKAGEAVLFIAEGSLFPVFVHGPLGQDERVSRPVASAPVYQHRLLTHRDHHPSLRVRLRSCAVTCRTMLIVYGICRATKTPLPAVKALTLTCPMNTLPIAMTSRNECVALMQLSPFIRQSLEARVSCSSLRFCSTFSSSSVAL